MATRRARWLAPVVAALSAVTVVAGLSLLTDGPRGGGGDDRSGPRLVFPPTPDSTLVALPRPRPVTDAALARLLAGCARDLAVDTPLRPSVSLRAAAGDLVVARSGDRVLLCSDTGGDPVAGTPLKMLAGPATPGQPFRTVDDGGGWDGRVWSAVLRVHGSVAHATVSVDGGPQAPVAIGSDGFALAAAVSGHSVHAQEPLDHGHDRYAGYATPQVTVTAYGPGGEVVSRQTRALGYFGSDRCPGQGGPCGEAELTG
ncbi:MAG: hypothetical protein ACRDV1_06505 [Actinomycetes bacterium]